MKNMMKNRKGFTLIEILVVIGILAVLFAIVLIAINPARQFSQANNTKRRSDANALLNAIHQYAADNRGALPNGIGTTAGIIADGDVDICSDLVTRYLAALPVDPLTNNGAPVTDCATVGYTTNYQVYRSGTDNRVVVVVPTTELAEPTIFLRR